MWIKERRIMMEAFMNRILKLLSVKSIVTLVLTAVFARQAVVGQISQDFMTVYAVVIAFYYGTQSTKKGESEQV